jgi:hypothetical protein
MLFDAKKNVVYIDALLTQLYTAAMLFLLFAASISVDRAL